MRPTRYNKKITVQRATEVADDTGGYTFTWADLFETWASVIPVQGAKRMEYGRTDFNTIYEVEARPRQVNMTDEDQVIYNGNTYQVTALSIDDHTVKFDMVR